MHITKLVLFGCLCFQCAFPCNSRVQDRLLSKEDGLYDSNADIYEKDAPLCAPSAWHSAVFVVPDYIRCRSLSRSETTKIKVMQDRERGGGD